MELDMADPPGSEDAAYLGFRLVDRLLDLLKTKGIVSPAEIVTLLEQLANDLSQDTRAVAQRSVGYVRNTMIPEHKVGE
jgi:hypothetical protein